MLIDVDGHLQLVVYGGQTVNGLDPGTGALLWTVEHETTGDMNTSTPIWGDDNVLLVTSAYDGGTRALGPEPQLQGRRHGVGQFLAGRRATPVVESVAGSRTLDGRR